ncbi:LacI family DNA-binding transcriptional regulator [Streptomyces sp. NPDC056105]|uniref:LacI family DNA-binding transcriptional regulator n=1 Tax=Streptomyces sp. NPDC056105 TaxID=3345714 RepID=UPI0035E22F38
MAELAGVSRAAVSFVFSGRARGNLSAGTRATIRAAADELGYRPDEVARSLRTRRSAVIGMLSDEIATSPFAGHVVLGAMEAARARGHQVLLLESRKDPALEAEAVAELRARRSTESSTPRCRCAARACRSDSPSPSPRCVPTRRFCPSRPRTCPLPVGALCPGPRASSLCLAPCTSDPPHSSTPAPQHSSPPHRSTVQPERNHP